MKTSIHLSCTIALVSVLASCAGEKPAQTPETSAAGKSEGAPAASDTSTEKKGLRLYVFECGEIDVLDDSVFHPGIGKPQKRKLTDSCYLIVHPKGTLAWDAGLSDELAKKPEGLKVMEGRFVFHVRTTLASQYQAIGVDPASVGFLGISHMHSDHRGNVGLFPRSTLLLQKEEYESAFGPDAAKYENDPATYPTLKANPVKKLDGDFDVFGDGTVVIKRALGHTPGHQALFVKLPKTGNILLSGDLVHFTDNWKQHGVPAWNFDKEQTLKTMQDTEQFLKANQATLWIQHDYEQGQTLRHAPAYFE